MRTHPYLTRLFRKQECPEERGTASKDRLLRRKQPDDELLQTGAADETNLTDETRPVLGASYYWVMDLAGSAWEKQGDHDGGGYGYRGGGYYLRGSAETMLNPHSRVAQRPYGAWGGGPRGVAYGFRAARTADQ